MPTYTITELAREFDITSRTIRFCEDRGMLNSKREGIGGRIRVYTARERTRLTLRDKWLGLNLAEIAAQELQYRQLLEGSKAAGSKEKSAIKTGCTSRQAGCLRPLKPADRQHALLISRIER